MDNIIVDSNREYTQENFLKVENCTLTSACVNEYLGKEIKGYQELGLSANQLYGILRPKEELEKALDTFNDIPVVNDHFFVLPEKPNKDKWLGMVSGHAHFKGDDVVNNIALWDQKAVQYIEKADSNEYGGKKDLSVGYTYKLEKQSGTYKGKRYDFVMRDIKANHLALVKDGRVDTAMVADSNFSKGNNLMKKDSWFTAVLDSLMGDKKATDNHALMNSMKELAGKDSEEFEGGEIEQAKAIIELAKKIEASEKVEDAIKYNGKAKQEGEYKYEKDSEEEVEEEKKKKVKDKRAIDEEENEKEKKVKDKEDEEKEKKVKDKDKESEEKEKQAEDTILLVNKYLNEKEKVQKLCTSVIGKIADSKMSDSNPEELINSTLKARGINYTGKSYDVKMGMIEALASVKSKQFQYATDSKASAKPKVVSPFQNSGVK